MSTSITKKVYCITFEKYVNSQAHTWKLILKIKQRSGSKSVSAENKQADLE